jgi:hypothetical protein
LLEYHLLITAFIAVSVLFFTLGLSPAAPSILAATVAAPLSAF